MTDKTHKITTIADLYNLEIDEIKRFCEEIPGHFEYMKAVEELVGVARLEMPFVWIDDGKADMDLSISDGNKEMRFVKNES